MRGHFHGSDSDGSPEDLSIRAEKNKSTKNIEQGNIFYLFPPEKSSLTVRYFNSSSVEHPCSWFFFKNPRFLFSMKKEKILRV